MAVREALVKGVARHSLATAYTPAMRECVMGDCAEGCRLAPAAPGLAVRNQTWRRAGGRCDDQGKPVEYA